MAERRSEISFRVLKNLGTWQISVLFGLNKLSQDGSRTILTLAVWKYFVAQGVSPTGPLARIICIVLTKREGYTGRISTRGLDAKDRVQRGHYSKD